MSTCSGVMPTLCPESASVSHANSIIEPRAAARIAASTSRVLPSTRSRSPLASVISVTNALTPALDNATVWLSVERRACLVGLVPIPQVQDHLDEA